MVGWQSVPGPLTASASGRGNLQSCPFESVLVEASEYRACEKTGNDVRPEFAGDVYLRITVRWQHSDFELVVCRSNERADIVELLVSLGNWFEHLSVDWSKTGCAYKSLLTHFEMVHSRCQNVPDSG